MKKHHCILAVLLAIATAQPGHAAVLAYDGFETTASGDKNNGIYDDNNRFSSTVNTDVKGGAIIGFGNNNWTDSTSLITLQQGGLSVPGKETQDGYVRYDGSATVFSRFAHRQMDAAPPNTTIYMSALFMATMSETSNNNEGGWVGFTDGDSANYFEPATASRFDGIMWGFAGNGTGMDLVVRGGGGTDVILGNISLNQTYMVTLALTPNLAGNDTVAVYLNGSDIATTTLSNRNYIDAMSDLSYGTIYTRSDATGGSFFFDELRMATTLAEANAIVPEPSTIALFGLAGLAMLARRRRR